jgi:catechol 2,3-dioxygenase-like lactoylglutathione lyase family enzyme
MRSRIHLGQASRLVFTAGLLTAAWGVPRANAENPLPVDRLAGVTFRGADLKETCRFYGQVLGFAEVHPMRDSAGRLQTVHFKVNDDQFLTFHAGTAEDRDAFCLKQIALQTADIGQARAWVEARQLAAGPIAKNADGNLQFSLTDPDGIRIDFVEYQPGSWQSDLRGKDRGTRRVSQRLQHAGLAVANEAAAMAFYRQKLGFWEQNRGGPPANPGEIRWIIMMMPRSKADFRGDFIEFMVHAADPPERRQHLCFAVADIDQAHQELMQRPGLEQRFKPFTTANGLKLMNVRDPNGLRVEFWEVKVAAKD